MKKLLMASSVLMMVIGLVACGSGDDKAVASSAGSYQEVADVHQTMLRILEPAADIIWRSAGTIITVDGDTELAPTTDEGWERVVNAATIVAESGNLLIMPGRSAGADWVEYANGLTDTGKLAIAAAQNQSSDELFDAGGRIYQVCKACHNQYLVKSTSSD